MSNKISIIIPIYNSEKYLDDCIISVVNQTYKNFELLLINDGSQDRSREICKKYQEKDKRIVYIEQPNLGVSSARNKGIEVSTGDYIVFLDSDDYISENFLKTLMDKSDSNTLVGSYIKKVFRNKIVNRYHSSNIYQPHELLENIISDKEMGNVWGYLYDAKIVKLIQFDPAIGFMEDAIFLVDYLNKSKIIKVEYFDNCYYYYRANPNSITRIKSERLKKCLDIEKALKKIDKITNYKYKFEICNKKTRIIESELSLSNSSEDFMKIVKKIKLDGYIENKKRYIVFLYLYRNQKFLMLKMYYICRNIAKKIYTIINNLSEV